jgi:hypothetical protein
MPNDSHRAHGRAMVDDGVRATPIPAFCNTRPALEFRFVAAIFAGPRRRNIFNDETKARAIASIA